MFSFFNGMGGTRAAVRRHPGIDLYAAIRRDDAEVMEIIAMAMPLMDDS